VYRHVLVSTPRRSLVGLALVATVVAYGSLISTRASAAPQAVAGTVKSAAGPLSGFGVTLFAGGSSSVAELGSSTTAADGTFFITYAQPQDPNAVLYLRAAEASPTGGPRSLWSVLGPGPAPDTVVVDEATTVATAYAMAQFTDGTEIRGPSPGLPNAAAMAHNLADVRTGDLSPVLLTTPNGGETRTRDTFDSLANAVSACVETAIACEALFDAATSPQGTRPDDTFAALVNVAHDPWHHIPEVFTVSMLGPRPHQPFLAAAPPGWTLALRFVGDGTSVDGPGNVVVDDRGHLWVNNNYVYSADSNTQVCGSGLLSEFLPDGRYASGSPYSGGGLNGAGFGIGRDPYGDIWVGNFGFASPGCADPPPHNSVSQFRPDGTPVSPDTAGWTQGNIAWPQATVSDDQGTIWIANCNNNSVTIFPGGDPTLARQLTGLGTDQPFGIAFGKDGTAFVTGSASSTVAMIGPDGTPRPGSPISGAFLHTPMGVATDRGGNVWIVNQGVAAPNCPTLNFGVGVPSLALLGPDGTPAPGAPFTGGGLRVPWGVAVDGNDNVWVADFAEQRVSEFCGVPAIGCRPGSGAGDPISPDVTGYGFDGLTRNTGVAVDPSGNVWLVNNWKQDPLVPNPGGYEVVAFVGMAGPVQPLPPRPRPSRVPAPVPVPPRFTG
jgi:NHL repeat